MPTERTYRSDGGVATSHIGADKSDDDIAGAQATDRLTDTSRLGSKGKGGGPDAPKQQPGESPADFGRRYREWNDKNGKTPQKAAYGEMLRRR